MLNEIYTPRALEAELQEIEQSLSNIEREFPAIARNAAQLRFDLEIARAKERERLETLPLAEGEKKPTIPALDAKIDLATERELEASRMATAELDIAKTVLSSLQSRLSSIQTRSKMSQMEMSLAR